MNVYAHFYQDEINDIQYRWRTLLQFGNSWDVIGTVYMKNPGSSKPIRYQKDLSEDIMVHLKAFDDYNGMVEWAQFTVDNTMSLVGMMMNEYFVYNKKSLNGVVQIFNLFNVRDADLGKAMRKEKQSVSTYTYTVDVDIQHLVAPIYIGWGNLWADVKHKVHATKIFNAVLQKTNYLNSVLENNKYYHPQYLMGRGKNRPNSILIRNCFYQNTKSPDIIDFAPARPINNTEIATAFKNRNIFKMFNNKSEHYELTNDLEFTVSHTKPGYVAIRHKNYKGKYSTNSYSYADEIRNILKQYGYDIVNNDVWLGTKTFKEYNGEVVDGIVVELKEIKEKLNQI